MLHLGNLEKTDPQTFELIVKETERQGAGFEMIASENIASPAVLEAIGTPLTNKYSEGYPGKRYYGGNQVVDMVESLAIERAKKLFGAEHANVQPYSGSQANQAAYLALATPGDTILGMDLAHGGHLTHGSPVNFSGKIFRFAHYGVRKSDERIDMDEVRTIALRDKPKIIIVGSTAYPRHFDFPAFRKIADEVGAALVVDMAHFAGLVAARVHPDPIPCADIVTSTTHKTLRGPRGGMILCHEPFAKAVDSAVFPCMQGGPHENIIAAKAVCFGEALEPSFAEYGKQVVANAAKLAEVLAENGIRLISGGTDNHLVLADVSGFMTGKEAETHLDEIGLSVNRNMIPWDTRKPFDPSGIRIGTPAATTRGLKEKEVGELARIIADVIKSPTDTVKTKAKKTVAELAKKFPLPY
jgi:glycine hydroxymethyltransferase